MYNSAFGDYELSEYALKKLAEVKTERSTNESKHENLWKALAEESEETSIQEIDNNIRNDQMEDTYLNNTSYSSQFYFSQSTKISNNLTILENNREQDIEKLLHETLEQPNGIIDLSLLKNLTHKELIDMLNTLSTHISSTGLINVIKSMFDFDAEEKMKYFDILCAKLIVEKLSTIEKGERNLTNNLEKLTQKFPDEIKKMIFIPILNSNIKESSAILNIVNVLNRHSKYILLQDFTSHANEIKEWHFLLLEKIITKPIKETVKNQLLQMFFDKCIQFSKNRFFGKLMLSFISASESFTTIEKNILDEIADTHKTPLKRTIENAIKKVKLFD